MKTTFRYLFTLLVVALTLASCSKKKNSALEVIPEDFQVVMNIQLNKIDTAAAEVLNTLLSAQQRQLLADLGEALALDNTVLGIKSMTDQEDLGKIILAIPVKDEAALSKAFDGSKTKNGFKILTSTQGISLAVKDNIAYCISEQDLQKQLHFIQECLEDCDEDGSMAKVKAAFEAFAGSEDVLTSIFKSDAIGQKDKQHGGHPMSIFKVRIKDKNTIDFNGYAVYPDGTRFKMEQPLVNLSPEALKYAGADPMMTLALGIPGNFNWKKTLKQINEALEEVNKNLQISQADMLLYQQFLSNIDGTVLVSISMNGDLENTINTRPNLSFIMQCKPGTEGAVLNMIKVAAQKSQGIDLKLNPDLTPTENNVLGIPVYFGALDGMVILSTTAPQQYDNNLPEIFKGKQLGYVWNIPDLSKLVPALDTRMNFTAVMEGDEVTGSFSCLDKPIVDVLKSIVSMVAI